MLAPTLAATAVAASAPLIERVSRMKTTTRLSPFFKCLLE